MSADDTRWQERANCRGLDTTQFFPQRGEDTRHAKEVCRRCTVRTECLAAALDRRERFGVWGGLSERERRALRRARRAGIEVASA
jgi:WhiB family redox-sensing transcriptional regulator